jgi:uncharacterized lipoprotein YmbA
MKKLTSLFGLFALLVSLFGCAASSPSRFYTLNAMAQPTSAAFQYVVSVGPVLVPSVLDRPQIVTRIGLNQVQIDEFNRWASPLKTDIARVVAENLMIRLGTTRVTIFPESTADGATYRITIDVLRFESSPGESATIDALWTIRQMADGRSLSGRSTWREPVNSSGFDALVAAHSRALDRLSEDIAKALLAP